ncbi:MAG: sugar O-acetyltransferase [Clostridia bacterium]|nr:sugar O-acetyltransferase [Clostridia bacterium]
MSNTERREKGLLFLADDDDWAEMKHARRLLWKMNHTDTTDFDGIRAIANELLGKSDETTFINPPFTCDYGKNIEVGRNFFANYNCIILDNAKVTIGDNCLIAPNVSIYTAGHAVHPDNRAGGWEYGIPVTIGDNVWIGGNTVICPGVTIGDSAVIGAGSVVTHDIPPMTVAAGNPCRILRAITEDDRKYYFRDREIDPETRATMDNQ